MTPFGTVQVGDNVTAVYRVTNQAPTPTAMSTTFAVNGTGLSVDSHLPAALAEQVAPTAQVTLATVSPATATTVSGTLSAGTGYNALLSNQVQAGTARSRVQGSLSLSIPILAANATLTPGWLPHHRLGPVRGHHPRAAQRRLGARARHGCGDPLEHGPTHAGGWHLHGGHVRGAWRLPAPS